MEKSLKYSGILSVSPYGIYLKNAGDITLDDAVRKMMGVDNDKYADAPCEFVIYMNRYGELEINGEKFEVSKVE